MSKQESDAIVRAYAPDGEQGAVPQECVKHQRKSTRDNAANRKVIYSSKAGSYREDTRMPAPAAFNKAKAIKRRPEKKRLDHELIIERRRILALLAAMSDETLKDVFPDVELALMRAAANGKVCAAACAPPGTSEPFRREAIRSTQRRCKNGKLKLPKLPPDLHWPKKRFSAERSLGIVAFLEREWAGLIARGFGELRWVRLVDSTAATAVDSYERPHRITGERRRLPAHLRLLREAEITDLKLAEGMDAIKNDARLLETIVRRLKRGAHVHIP